MRLRYEAKFTSAEEIAEIMDYLLVQLVPNLPVKSKNKFSSSEANKIGVYYTKERLYLYGWRTEQN